MNVNLWKTSARRAPKSLSGSPAALPGGDLLPAGAVGGEAPSAVPATPSTVAAAGSGLTSPGAGSDVAAHYSSAPNEVASGTPTGPGARAPERPNDEGAGHRPTVAAAAPPTPRKCRLDSGSLIEARSDESGVRVPGSASGEAKDPAGPADNATARAVVGAPSNYLDFIADLEDALATAEATRPPREFAPDTEERVDWLLRKLFEDQERAARIRAAAEARCAEIDGRMRYLASKYAAPLAEFVESELPKARRGAKSIRLSEGIVGFRDEKGGPRVEDVRAVERWAEAHDDPTAPRFGEWAYRVDKDRVLAHVLATGESVPGVEIREPKRLLYAQSDLRDPRGKKAMKTIQITRLAAEALVAPPADEPEEE